MTRDEQKNEMARLVSDGLAPTPAHAARMMGLKRTAGQRLWRSICNDLGWQAV